jgi:ribosomal protein L11 methyltransferase
MDYIQLTCKIESNSIELFREILTHELSEIGYESFSDTESGMIAWIQSSKFNCSDLDNIDFYKNMDLGSFEFCFEEIKDQNWNEEWEKNFAPVNIDDKCYIRAPFHERRTDIPFEIVMIPKMAFGTGHHETTSQMVSQMFNFNLEEKEVLDMGCGTGVLAIMASMLKAKHILAIDIDEWAYNSTIENSLANNITNITPKQGDIDLVAGLKFDIILANINRNILLAQMAHYSKCLDKNGILLVSGIYIDDIPTIEESAKANGFSKSTTTNKNNWASVLFIKS